MIVYPLAPLLEVVGTTLLSDTLESADANTIVEWDGDRPLLSRGWMGVL